MQYYKLFLLDSKFSLYILLFFKLRRFSLRRILYIYNYMVFLKLPIIFSKQKAIGRRSISDEGLSKGNNLFFHFSILYKMIYQSNIVEDPEPWVVWIEQL